MIIYTNILLVGKDMKKLQINSEHRALIESVIRESSKFRGHEELIEIFCDAVYKKSYLLIDAIKDMSRLRRHLIMICDNCMEQIIKEKIMFEQTRIYRQIEHNSKLQEDVVSLKDSPYARKNIVSVKNPSVLDDDNAQEIAFQKENAKRSIVNLKEEIQRSEKYDNVDTLIDPLEFCPQKRVSEHTVEKLMQLVRSISSKFPNKRFYEIFSLRYIRRYNQTEIAREMKISQVELSKRFVELIKLTRENL